MRIISDFRDYYDSAMAFGQDNTRIYARNWSKESPTKFEYNCGMPNVVVDTNKWHNSTRSINRYLLFFCGKLYPFYRKDTDFYGTQTAFSFEKSFDKVDKENPPVYVKQRFYENKERTTDNWRQWISDNTGRDVSSINIQFNSPIVMLERHVGTGWNRVWNLYKDFRMADFKLEKLIDPFTAFQEIDMFIGGVLTQNFDPPAPMTDKQKVLSHGLDPVYGFRKPPAK